MTSPIFLDANVPIYAAGSPHPLKDPCSKVILLVADNPHAFFTDAEVLQELLHRYLGSHRWPEGRDVFQDFAQLIRERIEPIYAADVESAAELADGHARLSARDLLHVAVMNRLGLSRIVSTDSGFDELSGIERLDPAQVDAWQQTISPAS